MNLWYWRLIYIVMAVASIVLGYCIGRTWHHYTAKGHSDLVEFYMAPDPNLPMRPSPYGWERRENWEHL